VNLPNSGILIIVKVNESSESTFLGFEFSDDSDSILVNFDKNLNFGRFGLRILRIPVFYNGNNKPMIRHLASRFKLLNRYRLREIVATYTIFSSVRAVGGARCAQVFYGLTSHHMDIYGMESKSQSPDVYRELIRDQGVPSSLHRDNATEQKSNIVTQLNRDYELKESLAEVGYPNQNPVEYIR
jgi:hypothetical protein